MKSRLFLAFLSISLLIGNTQAIQAKTRLDRENDVREVLVRSLISKEGTTHKKSPTKRSKFDPPEIKLYYFSLLIHGAYKDPDNLFLKRFEKENLPIRKGSESYIDPNSKDSAWSQVKDKKTKELGIRFYIGRINWLSKNSVNVQVKYSAGLLNAGSARYWLRFSNDHWKFIKTTDNIVS